MRWEEDTYGREDTETNWQYVQRLWDTALEEQADPPPFPRPTPPPAAKSPASLGGFGSADPWASGSAAGYSDEPPF